MFFVFSRSLAGPDIAGRPLNEKSKTLRPVPVARSAGVATVSFAHLSNRCPQCVVTSAAPAHRPGPAHGPCYQHRIPTPPPVCARAPPRLTGARDGPHFPLVARAPTAALCRPSVPVAASPMHPMSFLTGGVCVHKWYQQGAAGIEQMWHREGPLKHNCAPSPPPTPLLPLPPPYPPAGYRLSHRRRCRRRH